MTEEKAPKGFKYALEAMRTQLSWARDRLLQDIAAIDKQLLIVDREIEDLREAHGQVCESATLAEGFSIDPQRRANVLAYMGQLHQQTQLCQSRRRAIQKGRDQLSQRLLVMSSRLQAYDRHRSECVQAFRQEQLRLEVAEADRDWLSRLETVNS